MALTPGSKFGPYEIQVPLGAGGMGEVYRATQSSLGRQVAIKVLASASASDPERLRRFEQEARAASALNHPNIISIYDSQQWQDPDSFRGRGARLSHRNCRPGPSHLRFHHPAQQPEIFLQRSRRAS